MRTYADVCAALELSCIAALEFQNKRMLTYAAGVRQIQVSIRQQHTSAYVCSEISECMLLAYADLNAQKFQNKRMLTYAAGVC
jgi:hypothetical protein